MPTALNIGLSLLLCTLNPLVSIGQEGDNNTANQIAAIESEIVELNTAVDELKIGLEKLKLKYCHDRIAKYGIPAPIEGEQVVHHKAMSLSYNEEHEQANWVVHLVTKDVAEGNVTRTNDFRKDPMVVTGTAAKDDYWYSGYDRGHLAPSADFRWSQIALSESYFYSNMSPQTPELNREGWARLESKIREWAITNGELLVVTGGILKNGLPVIKATNQVSIPESYFKIVVDYTLPEIKGIAFIYPNGQCESNYSVYATSIDSVQRLTGFDLFHKLPKVDQEKIESSFNLDLWEKHREKIVEDEEPLDVPKGMMNTAQAKDAIGKKGTVCGTVVATKYHAKGNGKPTFVNLDKKFPNRAFSFTIWHNDRKNFSYNPAKALLGEKICVTSQINEYKGIPVMEIRNEKQIQFWDEMEL